jgi:hypothetical protein
MSLPTHSLATCIGLSPRRQSHFAPERVGHLLAHCSGCRGPSTGDLHSEQPALRASTLVRMSAEVQC